MLKKKPNNILVKKYLSFLASQEIRSEYFYDKPGQLKNFYLPICEKIYQDYKKNNPNDMYIMKVSAPRINKFKMNFPELIK